MPLMTTLHDTNICIDNYDAKFVQLAQLNPKMQSIISLEETIGWKKLFCYH